MKIMKFGGTSVGSPTRMKDVVNIINKTEKPAFVVLSAMSGTTNSLIEISNYLYKKNIEGAGELIKNLEHIYNDHINNLYTTPEYKDKMHSFLKEQFHHLRSFRKEMFTTYHEKEVVGQGEILSTNMFVAYLQECGVDAVLLPALDFMRIDRNNEPDMDFISENLNKILEEVGAHSVYVTQGFICRNAYGEIDNLQRGGSDYTASLIGAVLKAEEIQIWTDIDGMHNNDPRIVDNTMPVRQLNFEEAAELAYFGAKILHPTCVQPAKYAGVPVRLLNTMDPSAPGTIIDNNLRKGLIKAVAVKDNITAIKVKSSRMLLAAGFLFRVFEIFKQYNTAVDMVSTSEVGVSMSIDNTLKLEHIEEELQKLGTVTIDHDMCIICVAGDLDWMNVGFETLATEAMKDIPVRMISYGGSNYNISFLIRKQDKEKALKKLSSILFN